MVVFRKKEFTIPEGHYTGPKDIDKVPGAIETITKGALGGAGIGAVAGGVLKDTTMLEGALTGAKYGTLGGIVAKLFLNYVHKPMTSVKYQEVDKNIRRQFGVFRMAGVTVGDTLDKRAKIDDKFSFNDRDVSSYKLNFAIHNNQVTMYTFGMTREELDKTSKILDYYCKKFFSMEYSAKIINQKVNSYSVDITFTNYYALCNFIMELSQTLNTKINLLDNNVIITSRLQEAKVPTGIMEAEEEKEFSLTAWNKYDVVKLLGSSLSKALGSIGRGKNAIAAVAQSLIFDTLTKMGRDKVQEACGVGMMRGDYDNKFLEATLKKLHYVDGFHYTTGDSNSELQMSLISGVLCISCLKENCEDLDDKVWKSLKTKISRSDTGKVIVYTYALKDTKEFELILNKLMKTGSNPNIFDKSIKFKKK